MSARSGQGPPDEMSDDQPIACVEKLSIRPSVKVIAWQRTADLFKRRRPKTGELMGRAGQPRAMQREAIDRSQHMFDPPTPAALKRMLTERFKSVTEQHLGSEAGRLYVNKELTDREFAASVKVANIYGQFERLHRLSRCAASPSYLIGRGSAASDEETDDQRERSEATEKAWRSLQKTLEKRPTKTKNAIEDLVVASLHIDPTMLPDVKAVLGSLADMWRIPGVNHGGKDAPRFNQRIRPAAATATQPRLPRLDLYRRAFEQMVRRLRPDLTDEKIAEAWRMQTALIDREIFNQQRAA
jgi:hypothetical protein